MGKISKDYLDRINKDLREKTQLIQWRNTGEVIKWFNNLQNKGQLRFFKFDIESFYPSISLELLKKSITFARQYTYSTL